MLQEVYTFPREWRDEIVQAQGTISDESLSSLSSGSDTLDSIDTDSDNEKTSGQALIGKGGSLPVRFLTSYGLGEVVSVILRSG